MPKTEKQSELLSGGSLPPAGMEKKPLNETLAVLLSELVRLNKQVLADIDRNVPKCYFDHHFRRWAETLNVFRFLCGALGYNPYDYYPND